MYAIIIASSIILAGIIAFVEWVLAQFWKYRGYLETLGIPVIKPGFIFGSPPYAMHKLIISHYYRGEFDRLKCKTFGTYRGSDPVIVTIDPEILKEVFQKQFENFTMNFKFTPNPEMSSLDLSHGEVWRNLRKEMSPTFTSGKLKGMTEPMTKIADRYVAHLRSRVKKQEAALTIDPKHFYDCFTLDTIASCAFGIDTNALEDPENKLLKTARGLMDDTRVESWIGSFFCNFFEHFPQLISFVMTSVGGSKISYLNKITTDLMANREKSGNLGNDFIARLIELKAKIKEPTYDGVLTEEYIPPQGTTFFVAGYETTASSLSSLSYFLSQHPDVQDKIYREICSLERIDMETIQELDYLECTINETLRMMPPAIFVDRVCTSTTTIQGMKILKGAIVRCPIWSSHYEEDYFPQPHLFKPERFDKDHRDSIIPLTWRPFGAGNRICIAMRFAMMKMKIVTAKILKEFKIVPNKDTKLKLIKGDTGLCGVEKFSVDYVPRTQCHKIPSSKTF